MLISASSPSRNIRNREARILTVGSYQPTLKTWHMLLEAQGYRAVSFVLKNGATAGLFTQGMFDVIILGQSVDDTEKRNIVEAFRQCSTTPIISIPSRGGEPTDGADIYAEPDPEELLGLIANLVDGEENRVPA